MHSTPQITRAKVTFVHVAGCDDDRLARTSLLASSMASTSAASTAVPSVVGRTKGRRLRRRLCPCSTLPAEVISVTMPLRVVTLRTRTDRTVEGTKPRAGSPEDRGASVRRRRTDRAVDEGTATSDRVEENQRG
eukprot:1191077-Prorocentrum_minimum.AAC.5